MEPNIRIFTEPEIMADSLAEEFYRHVTSQFITRQNLYIALSGGNTPLLFYNKLSAYDQQKKNKIDWSRLHFFWGDERCVPSDHVDSNYGNANKVLFSLIQIPKSNVNPIQGENDPVAEVKRYNELLSSLVPRKNEIPIFDWVFLGVGEDGHTASIFPDKINLMNSERICTVTEQPGSDLKRITMTGLILNNAKRITFMATGIEKQEIIKSILNREAVSKKYPAALVAPKNGIIDWYLDSQAADLI